MSDIDEAQEENSAAFTTAISVDLPDEGGEEQEGGRGDAEGEAADRDASTTRTRTGHNPTPYDYIERADPHRRAHLPPIVDEMVAIKQRTRKENHADGPSPQVGIDNKSTAKADDHDAEDLKVPTDVPGSTLPIGARSVASLSRDGASRSESSASKNLVSRKVAIAMRRSTQNSLETCSHEVKGRQHEISGCQSDGLEGSLSDIEATSVTSPEGSDKGPDTSTGQEEGFLIEAEIVNEHTPVHAEVVSEEQLAKQRRWRVYGGVAVIVITAAIVSLLAVFLQSEGEEEPLNNYDTLMNLLLPVSGDSLLNATTYQYQTFQWLASEDPAELDARTTDPQVVIDRYVLALLYITTGGPTWDDDLNFLSNSSVCEWKATYSTFNDFKGVKCNNAGTVDHVSLDENNINGTLPTELGALLSLERLGASRNILHGTIPASIGNLPLLKDLNLYINSLTGTIPSTLGNSDDIVLIMLDDNKLTGTIPPEISSQQSLEFLSLSSNKLTGTIPEFHLSGRAQSIDLGENALTGTIPQSIFALSDLESLHLVQNFLTGTVSSRIGVLGSLVGFDLSYNDFGGPLPSEIGLLDRFNFLYVESNHFNSTIPTELGKLRDVRNMFLDLNWLTGRMPSELGSLTKLEQLTVNSNNITGNVPSSLATLSSLELLWVHNTSITGSFDETFCAREAPLAPIELYADCGGMPPDVECSCCQKCCDDATAECKVDTEAVCQASKLAFEIENVDVNLTCECLDNGSKVLCADESTRKSCQYCNESQSICYIYVEVGIILGNDSYGDYTEIGWFEEVEYTVGPVGDHARLETFRTDYLEIPDRHAFVNNQACQSVKRIGCNTGYRGGYQIDCTNVQDNLLLNGCITHSDAGALELWAGIHDSYATQGDCIPVNQ